MTEENLQKIESSLGCTLPAHDRAFLLQNGDELARLQCTLYWRPEDIITKNAFARRAAHDVFTIGEGGPPWPTSHFMVGDNGAGDYLFIHLDADRGLWYFSSEGYTIEPLSTLEVYLESERPMVEDT